MEVLGGRVEGSVGFMRCLRSSASPVKIVI